MQGDPAAAIHARLTALETQNAVNTVHRVNVADRLLAIEDTLKWLVRLIVGAFIVSAMTYALQGGLALH